MITSGNILQTRIDDLTERIKIFGKEYVGDERGQHIAIADKFRCECWAKVLPLTSKSSDNTPARENSVDYRVIIRYRNDILPDDVIMWRGKELIQIAPSYDAESRKIWTVLTCREVIEDGAAR